MRVLIIGGTGLISVGIAKELLGRGARVAMFNRGQRPNTLPADVEQLSGNRADPRAFAALADRRFDAVIDMICFSPAQAEQTVQTFAARTEHVLFCSTCCTYAVDIPPHVIVRENDAQRPFSEYGKNKLICERLFLQAGAEGKFAATVIRPSCTYGPGSFLIDQLEFDTPAWGRIERGLPVLAAGDGLGLWQATHRDDVGRLFAHAVLNPKTYGQAYNATRDEVFTWRDFYRQAAVSLGRAPRMIFLPASSIVSRAPERFGLLAENTRYHGAYDSSKAKRDVPEFRCSIDFVDGARETIEDIKRRGVFRDGRGDTLYDAMVEEALAAGAEIEELSPFERQVGASA
jgi:nucleoside-diphosphate-sugar epimerase